MKEHKDFLPVSEQVARHLEARIRKGDWVDQMPGRERLAGELGVNRKTVERAFVRLEERGLLTSEGAGRRRKIIRDVGMASYAGETLRLKVLAYEPEDRGRGFMIDLLRRLAEMGHEADFSHRTMRDFAMNRKRIAGHVRSENADAWIVISGPREILEWFSEQSVPVFALFGRRHGLPMAGVGPNKAPVLRDVVGRLVGLGHRLIVMLSRKDRRVPSPGLPERTFLESMVAHGIQTGGYHLPDWEETPQGFQECLDRLFAVTPPTALILDEALFLGVARIHLARRGIFAPEDISILCQDSDPSFAWHTPSIAHMRWSSDPVIRRIVQWVGNVARGKADHRQSFTKAEFVDGGTIGPAKESGMGVIG